MRQSNQILWAPRLVAIIRSAYGIRQIGICFAYLSSASLSLSLDLFKKTEPKQRKAEPRHNHIIPVELLFPLTKVIIAGAYALYITLMVKDKETK